MEENFEVDVPEIENSVVFRRKIRLYNILFCFSFGFYAFFFLIILIVPYIYLLYVPNNQIGNETSFNLTMFALALTIAYLSIVKFNFAPNKLKIIIAFLIVIHAIDFIIILTLPSLFDPPSINYALAGLDLIGTIILILFLLNRTKPLKIITIIIFTVAIISSSIYNFDRTGATAMLIFRVINSFLFLFFLLDDEIYYYAVLNKVRSK